MAFTEAERTQIRRALGFPDINRQVDLRLEAAMSAVLEAGEDHVRDLLAELAEIQTGLRNLRGSCLKVVEADGVKLNAFEAILALRSEGDRVVMQLSDHLQTAPRRRIFGGGPNRLTLG